MKTGQLILMGALLLIGGAIGYFIGGAVKEKEYSKSVASLTSKLATCTNTMAEVEDQALYNEGALADKEAELKQVKNDKLKQKQTYEDSLATIRNYTNLEAERAIARHYARQKK